MNASKFRVDRTALQVEPRNQSRALRHWKRGEGQREEERKREVRGLLVTRQIMAAISFFCLCVVEQHTVNPYHTDTIQY